MICDNSLLEATLRSSLSSYASKLDQVGVDWSINSFELEMRNWATAFFGYSNLKLSSLSDASLDIPSEPLDNDDESVLNLVQIVFDILNEEVSEGLLIPRARNHLKLALLNLEVEFADNFESGNEHCRVENCDGLKTCKAQLLDSQSPDAEWLVSWLKKALDSKTQQTFEEDSDWKSG